MHTSLFVAPRMNLFVDYCGWTKSCTTVQKPWNDSIPLQVPTNKWFPMVLKVVRNGFCPPTVLVNQPQPASHGLRGFPSAKGVQRFPESHWLQKDWVHRIRRKAAEKNMASTAKQPQLVYGVFLFVAIYPINRVSSFGLVSAHLIGGFPSWSI